MNNTLTKDASQNTSVSVDDVTAQYPVQNDDRSTKDESEFIPVHVSGSKLYEFTKRAFDIVSSGLVLLILGWLILLLMLVKWLEDVRASSYKLEIMPATDKTRKRHTQYSKDGRKWDVRIVPDTENKTKDSTVHGAIYTSTRIGKNGKPFKFHKIRSMCKGAEKMKDQLMAYGINEADDPAFKLKYDPRITGFGRFLRKTSLDELPQIWDIFVGRMSVVGPRPPIPQEVERYTPYEMQRLEVKGGLLCLWQITNNRNKLSFDEWVDLDIEYIRKRSLWLDTKIIFKGAWFVLTDHSGE